MRWLVCLIYLLPSILEGKQVKVECGYYQNEVAMCEIHGITNLEPHWRTTVNGRLAAHERGIVVYLAVDDHWRGLEIYVFDSQGKKVVLIDTYVRYNPDMRRVVFAKGTP